jgi:hypothetical protein
MDDIALFEGCVFVRTIVVEKHGKPYFPGQVQSLQNATYKGAVRHIPFLFLNRFIRRGQIITKVWIMDRC